MIHMGMKNWIGTELSGPYIITVNDRAGRKRNTKISQEITNEIKFSSCIERYSTSVEDLATVRCFLEL